MAETVEQLLKRFYKNAKRDEQTGCLMWIGYANGGYGRFSIGNRSWLAHVLSYYFYYKELPKHPFHVLHKLECTSKLCIDPLHLYKGTEKDNKRDQIIRDGIRSGGRQRKLGTEQRSHVIQLSQEGWEQRQIAELFGVSQWNIWNILNTAREE